jgi:hypothetical protein
LSPDQIARGVRAWQRAVSALKQFISVAPVYEKQLREAGELTPEAQEALSTWLAAADKIKQRFANIIESNANLQQAIDAVGGGSAMAGLGYLGYFAELMSASADAMKMLRTPLTVGFQGLEAVQMPWLSQAANEPWEQTLQTLGSNAIATTGAAAISMTGDAAALDADVEAYLESQKRLSALITSGSVSAGEGSAVPKKSGGGAGLLIGAVAVGALGLFLVNRPK